jgi:Dyp-type peroxidase family
MAMFDETKYPTSKTVGVASEVTLIVPIKVGRVVWRNKDNTTGWEYRTYRQRLEDVLESLQDRESGEIPTPISFLRQIHFARWVILDSQRDGEPPRLLFTSNFDGEMKEYFRSFALDLTADIDEVWGNCDGYPGAADFDRLWQYVKRHQRETQAFYNAYRRLTVPQILKLDAFKQSFDEFASKVTELLARPEGMTAKELASRIKDLMPAARPEAPDPDPFAHPLVALLSAMQPAKAPGREKGPQSCPVPTGSARPIERSDIQANILGSPPWKRAGYLFLEVTKPREFGDRLSDLLSRDEFRFKSAADFEGAKHDHKKGTGGLTKTFNVGFSWSGLGKMAVPAEHLAALPLAFRQGMAARAEILGDVDASAPDKWDGRLGSTEIHVVIAAFTMGEDIDKYLNAIYAQLKDFCEERHRELGERKDKGGYSTEPFGFVDGIGQPEIVDVLQAADRDDTRKVPVGEFILGYQDADQNDQIAAALVGDGVRALCSNGTYMVFRKIEQDVEAFGRLSSELAEQFVGRRKDGTSLVREQDSPDWAKRRKDDARWDKSLDDFTYGRDHDGAKCPLASHVRRANPRDDLPAMEQRRHRIVRRGIPYDYGKRKGQLFVCFNARIESQFEFLQSEWCNKGDSKGHFTEIRDPLVGSAVRDPVASSGKGAFVDPSRILPVSLDRFVAVKGGEYVFVPGITALKDILGQKIKAPSAFQETDKRTEVRPSDVFDPVEYAETLCSNPALLPQLAIERRMVSWESDVREPQAIYYVAHPNQVAAILKDSERFPSAQYAKRIGRLMDDYCYRLWLGPSKEKPDAEKDAAYRGILQSILLSLSPTDSEKLERLRLLRRALGDDYAASIKAAVEGIAKNVTDAIVTDEKRVGFDVATELGYRLPIERVIGAFGFAQPKGRTEYSKAYYTLYFGRRSYEELERMGWLAKSSAYRSPPKYTWAEELAGLVQPISIFLLIDDYETPETLADAKIAVKELLDTLAQAIIAEEDRQKVSGAAAPLTLLGRLVSCKSDGADPVAFRLRVGMILAELIVGGVATTAKAITNVVNYLLPDSALTSPTTMDRARAAMGSDEALDLIILEALRADPVAPVIVRECPGGATLPAGGGAPAYAFDPGSRLFLLTGIAMHASSSDLTFGQGVIGEPEGAHACIGRHIVLAEIRAVLKSLLPKPLRRAAGPEGEMQEESNLPVSLKVRFDPASSEPRGGA